jgi:NADH:ubiquinone oxidoreductase subunit D
MRLRDGINNECPEDFQEELKKFIDTVENKVNEAVDLLNNTGINSLDNVTDALSLLEDLSQELF